MNSKTVCLNILLSALTSGVFSDEDSHVISLVGTQIGVIKTAKRFGDSRLVRKLNLSVHQDNNQAIDISFQGKQVYYQNQDLGRIKLLYKAPLPGELQARLAYESTIDRFLEYLQKQEKIVALHETDFSVQVFIPKTKKSIDINQLWSKFVREVLFSIYGDSSYQLPGLVQTLISMLNSVTLAGRGFSTLEVPIVTQQQSSILAAWYLAVVREVEKRQKNRHSQIRTLEKQLENEDLNDRERKGKTSKLTQKQEMQNKESKKYPESFHKSCQKLLNKQSSLWSELKEIQGKIQDSSLTKAKITKLQQKQDKITQQIIFTEDSIQTKFNLLGESQSDPFKFISLDREEHPDKFQEITSISASFTKNATDQINSTRGDIFSQCILEMYRLLENEPNDPLPEPLLREQPRTVEMRSPGDDGKDFCYSCGTALDPQQAKWKVARFMFERPSQRRQSSSSEARPNICATCSTLAFVSPLKVTEESIIIKLGSDRKEGRQSLQIQEYLRMLANKEMHLSSGRYLVLTSDKTVTGDLASQKLGHVQFAYAKIASKFPLEVLTDFKVFLVFQGSQEKELLRKNLIFIKGLMEGYGHKIITVDDKKKQIVNLTLGDGIRYLEQDSPYLAEYALVKVSKIANRFFLEQVRERYWRQFDENVRGTRMNSEHTRKKFKLYEDVAALTGLTYAFAQSLESTAKGLMKPEDAEREVSKLIEKVDDPIAFCYYSTLGDEKKTRVQGRLYHNPDNYFIYGQIQKILEKLGIKDREEKDESGKVWLNFYADDVTRIYAYFANPNTEDNYAQDKDWKNLTYNLKLSLYTRFPELVRKINKKSKGDK